MKKHSLLFIQRSRGFTIVELLIIILVIGILAGVVIVGYGAWRQAVADKAIQSDLSHAASTMIDARNAQSSYPTQIPSTFKASDGNVLTLVRSNAQTFCINGTSTRYPSISYYIDERSNGDPKTGACTDLQLAVESMSIGSNHACYVNEARRVFCWGNNDKGQTGAGTAGGIKATPVEVAGLEAKSVSSVAVGSAGHSCAATSYGAVYCWGANNFGQLGNGTTTDSATPVEVISSGVLAGEQIQSVSAGDAYTCALSVSGKVFCWGYGVNGRLGNGLYSSSSTPVAVSTSGALSGKTVTSLASGWTHTCVKASDNRAYCWGYGGYGAIGNGVLSDAGAPAAVTASGALNGKSVVSIASGYDHSCVVASDARAYCWGWNYYGQVGNNSTSVTSVPVAVSTAGALSGKSIKYISGGRASTCALATDNQVACWGDNGDGQLALGTASGYMTTPQQSTLQGSLAGKTVASLFVGHYSTCAIAVDKSLHCWGGNTWGQLGNGTTTAALTPQAINP